MAAYFFASPVDVEVKLDGEDDRKKVDMKTDKEKTITCPVYFDGEAVAGQVRHYYSCCYHALQPPFIRRSQYVFEMARS